MREPYAAMFCRNTGSGHPRVGDLKTGKIFSVLNRLKTIAQDGGIKLTNAEAVGSNINTHVVGTHPPKG